jgi:hypothetical protein
MTLSIVKILIVTNIDLDKIRQKKDQAPKQESKKHIQKTMQKQSNGIGRSTRKITGTLLLPRIFRFQNHQLTDRPQEEEKFIRVSPFRIFSTPRYQTIFFGLCYECNNFGHKVVNCIANKRNINNFESHTKKGYPRRPSETQRIIYDKFESLSTEVECYKCNNFVHMEKDCRMIVPPREPQQNNNIHKQEPQKRTWIRKKNQYSNEECTRSTS